MDRKKLNAEDLRVDSFEPARSPEEAQGTVHGYAATGYQDPNLCGSATGEGYTCKYPTAYYDSCPAGWTDFEPECNQRQLMTYYCCDGSGGAMC